MKVMKVVLSGILVLDLVAVHFKVAQLNQLVLIQASSLTDRLQASTAKQDRAIQKQELVVLRHTVGVQDRLALVEAQSNECKLQATYLSSRLDKVDPPKVIADVLELPNKKETDLKKNKK